MLVERKVPVLRLAHHGLAAADGALRVDELGRRKGGAALLALVAVSALGMAVLALAGDVAVGKEGLRLLVVILHAGLLDEFAFIVKRTEKVGSHLVMGCRRSARVHIERYAKFLERLLDEVVVTVNNILWGNALLTCPDGDGHSVFVRPADEEYIFLLQAQVTHVDVGRNIHTGEVANVYGTVGVGQRRSDGCSFEFLFHVVC